MSTIPRPFAWWRRDPVTFADEFQVDLGDVGGTFAAWLAAGWHPLYLGTVASVPATVSVRVSR